MSRILSQILSAKEPLFTQAINDLELKSGNTSVDVRLTADIQSMTRAKIAELNLDPNDTAGVELYHALQALIGLHNGYLSSAIGTSPDDILANQFKCIKRAIDSLTVPNKAWVIKQSVAKRLVKAYPPKKVMKQLGYKSVDSMLKRESITELIAVARFLETKTWMNRFIKSYNKLRSSDFEIRTIKILVLDEQRYKDSALNYIYKQKHNITHLKEHGIILILPLPIKYMRGSIITIMPMILHYLNEIRSYSAFFKMQQVRSNFGEVLVDTLLNDPHKAGRIGGQDIHWRIIQQHFGNQDSTMHPELFEPHVQPEDLYWRRAESILYLIEPALKFWENLDYVASLHPDGIVPLGLMDNAVSYCNSLQYGQQSLGYTRTSLWNKIYAQYIGQENFENQIVSQLNQNIISTDFLESL